MSNNNQTATLESVWATIQETQRQMQANERLLTEKLAILTEKLAETDEQLKSSSAKFDREMQESKAEFDRRMQESKVKYEQEMKDLRIEIGGIGNNNGDFAEEYFFNSFDRGQQTFFGEKFDRIEKKMHGGEPNSEFEDEYDIVFINCKFIAIIEAKFKARKYHVLDTVDKARTFRVNHPEYANHQMYLGLASFVFDSEVEKRCIENGIAVIKQVGENVVIYDENLKVF
jgi:hypothetical protein